ncbi:uncharacterized protein LOC135697105 [Ochlerotatus camptorhynchus]|uniref:uncharacterized protein LOC135697105 n=1 Tax=Ochlerotatus camptorhynchus TaxID=644619 RepID=UPI0031E2BBC0
MIRPLLILSLVLPLSKAFNWTATLCPAQSPLIDATIAIINQFFTAESDHLYFRRRATDKRNVLIQYDLISEILPRIELEILVQLETIQAQVLNQSRIHNVFFVDDYEAFGQISDKMRIRTYDYTGYFLVIVTDSSENSFNTVQQIMDELWSHYAVNVAVLLTYKDAPGMAYYYTFFPFGKGYCEKVQPLLWKIFRDGRFENPSRQFYPEKMKNFYECSLKVATFDIPPFMMLVYGTNGKVSHLDGIDGIVTRVLSQRLNFTLDVVVVDPPDWGVTEMLGNNTGASRYVRKRLVNFTVGYWSMTYRRNRYLGNTFTYYTSLMSTIIPPGEPYSSLEQLALPFKYIIWSCIGTILLIAMIVITTIKFHSSIVQHFVFGRFISTPVLNTFNIFFGGSLHRSPVRNFSRTLLAFWLFYSILIRTSYTGSLFKFLQLKPNKSTPQIIPNFIAAGYHIRMTRNFSYMFDAFPDVVPHLQQSNLTHFHAIEIDELQRPTTRYVLLAPIETIAYLNRNLTKQGKLLRVSRDRVYLSKLTIYTQRSAPILHPFNYILGQLNAAGLIDQWASAFSQTVFLKDFIENNEPSRLTVSQITGCLELLAFGLGLSCTLLIVECLADKWKRGHRRRVTFVL